MARAYYEAQSGFFAPETECTENEDGTYTIHLYEIVENEKENTWHTATSCWYTVDASGRGSDDITGAQITLPPLSLADTATYVGSPVKLRYIENGEARNEWEITDSKALTSCLEALRQLQTGRETKLRATDVEEAFIFEFQDGSVWGLSFEEGDLVEEGQLLYTLDASDASSSQTQAKNSYSQAKSSYDQAVSAKYPQADLSGTVSEVYVRNGDNVSAGTEILKIVGDNNLYIDFLFAYADSGDFYEGQTATIFIDGLAGTLTGTVDSIAATDSVGPGGTLVRQVTILVNNPGVLTDSSQGTASIGGVACASGAAFTYATSSQITAKASGDIDTLSVKEGDRVSKGQVIGMISEQDLETQIENARISLENAQLSLKSAQEKLEDYTITSTIDGEVIEKNLDVGDNINGMSSSGATVTYPAVIYDRSQLTFEMDIDEQDISQIQVGQKVEITADALDGQSFTGVVDKININGTTANGHTSYPVTVLVDGSPEELYPGMNVSAKIIIEEAGSVLTLPVEAVERGNTVLVATEDCLDEKGNVVDITAAEKREVTLGRNDDNYIEIVDGLEEGDVVLAPSPQGSSMMEAFAAGMG